ncbi:hypothetical protein LCGC14_2707470, partial [marine sediment metagenome]
MQVQEGSNREEIKNSFRRLVKKYHPDKNKTNGVSSEEKIKVLIKAYKTLTDSEKRLYYDKSLQSRNVERYYYTEEYKNDEFGLKVQAKRVLNDLLNKDGSKAVKNYELLKKENEGFDLLAYLGLKDYLDCKFLLAEEYEKQGNYTLAFKLYEDVYQKENGNPARRYLQEEIKERILRLSFTPEVKEAKQFWDNLDENVALVGANPERKDDRHSADRVRDKIDDARHRFADILNPDIMDPIGLIKEGLVNVLNISELSEKQANVALAYYLQELLNDKKIATLAKNAKRKSNKRYQFESPIFVIIEEAHVFIQKGEDTHAKYWASKIAREGRKFGLGLCVVSQRPRSIDSNVLSQMGSLAIMKIVQEDDQQQISSAAESISKDLIRQLT